MSRSTGPNPRGPQELDQAAVEARFGADSLAHATRSGVERLSGGADSGTSGPPLSRSEYRYRCLLRSTTFRRFLLEFHQKYPVIFDPGLKLKHARRWLQKRRIVERECGGPRYPLEERNGMFVWTPNTIEDLGPLAQAVLDLGLGTRLGPELGDGHRYFQALGSGTIEDWKRDFEALRARWPWVPWQFLRWPWTYPLEARPERLGPGQQVPDHAIGAVVRYDDGTEVDRDRGWRSLRPKGPTPRDKPLHGRAHPAVLAGRLAVWDRYQSLQSYRQVARRLGIAVSTVQQRYADAYRDIEGEPLAVTKALAKGRQAAAVEATDVEQFSRCGNCFRDPSQPFCQIHRAAGEAFVNQDSVGLRELPVGREPQARRRSKPRRAPPQK
jgi:hypothetical protein